VAFPLGNWRFRPGRVPTLAVILLCPFLALLGFWQLDRAAQKRQLVEGFDSGTDTVVLTGPSVGQQIAELPRYQRVEFEGHYESGRQFLLDNMTHHGAAGYQVLTPFAVGEGSIRVLVNRGWIPRTFGTSLLPNVEVTEDRRRVSGRITHLPRPGLELAGRPPPLPEWPKVVQFPVMETLAESLGEPLAARMVLLDAAEADGFVRDWRPVEFGPERHLAYAVQWFAMSATVLIIYLALNLRRTDDEGQ
jgi:surfeit locus 1 family protein